MPFVPSRLARHGSFWTRVDGRRLHARVAAPPGVRADSATPHVLLLPGLGMSSTYMVPLLERIARTRPAWSLDMPGHGRSPGGHRALPFGDQVRLLEGWLDAAGMAQVVVVGHSLGAQLAGEHARRAPRRVTGLVLLDPTCDRRHRGIVSQALRLASTQPLEPRRLLPIKARDTLHVGPVQVLDEFRHGQRHDLRAALAHVTVPVSIVRGSRDPIAPRRWIEELAAAAAGPAWTRELPGHAHCTNYTATEAVCDEVARVIAHA